MSKPNILIVGASIAGPMAAYWFARSGANVTVIERFPKIRPGGQNVDIRTVGVTIMRKIPGMEDTVRSKCIHLESMQLVRDNGTPFATMKTSGDPEQQSLVSEFEIFRDDLSHTLFDLTRDYDNVKYIFGEQVSALHHAEDGQSVTAEFKNGKLPTTTFDLVVACDGTNSRTRALGFDCGVRDHVVPLNAWAAYFSAEKDYLAGKKLGQMYTAIGGRAIACGPDNLTGNRVTAMAVLPRKDQSAIAPFRDAQKAGESALKKYVAQHYAGLGWKTPELLKEMMASDDFYASEWAQVKVPRLYNSRVVLVGDAGYAAGPTGGGTSLALAGAYVLAGEICDHGSDIDAGLKAYEQRMQPIIADLQKIPPGIPAVMAPQTRWGIWLRNVVFILVTWSSGFFGWVSKHFASSFGKDKYGLPDYRWQK